MKSPLGAAYKKTCTGMLPCIQNIVYNERLSFLMLCMFSEGFLSQLRSIVCLSEWVRKKVKLFKRGHEWVGLCPFHSEKSPSFTVNDDKGLFYCFGCQASGDIFAFLKNAEGMTFHQAVKELAQATGTPLPIAPMAEQLQYKEYYQALEWATLHFQTQLNSARGERARQYLKNRGISENLISDFRLGWCDGPSFMHAMVAEKQNEKTLIQLGLLIQGTHQNYPRFRNRLIFPIFNSDFKVTAFGGRTLESDVQPKYLNSPENPVFFKKEVLYSPPHRFKAGKKCVVAEGYLDVIALSPYVHSFAPLGTSASAETLAKLFRQSAEIYVCFDGDQAGRKASLQLALKMLPLISPKDQLMFIFLPAGEDPHSLITGKGFAIFESHMKAALSLSDFLWEMVRQDYLPSASAEQKARVHQQWNEWMEQVRDPVLRRSYQDFFKQKTYQSRFRPQALPPRAAAEKKDIISLHEKILLGICVHFPYILLQVQEFLAELNLSHPYFIDLQHALLLWCDEQSQDSLEDFDAFLEQKTGTRWREKMHSMLVHIPKNLHHDPEGLANYWKALFDEIRQDIYQKEKLQDLQQKAFLPEGWENLCQLYRLKYPEDL